MLELIFIGVIVTACFVVLDRQNSRSSTEHVSLRETLEREREAHRDETQALLQRIQAPEAAVVDHSMRDQGPDPEPFPQSDEQLAEAEERRRALQFIERYES